MAGKIKRSHEADNKDRMRRARSWLKRSEEVGDDEAFIFLWIAFNAAYGREFPLSDETSERRKYEQFLNRIINKDHDENIENIIWKKFSGPVRVLVKNQYIYEPFWRWVREEQANWKDSFERDNKKILKYMQEHNTLSVLDEVFKRLYTLRNQIFHGGTTSIKGTAKSDKPWSHPQLRDGRAIMAALVPAILDIMQTDIDASPDSEIWGVVIYPRVDEDLG